MRVLVCGGRDYDDWESVDSVLYDLLCKNNYTLRVIHGNARGADFLARAWVKYMKNTLPKFNVSQEAYDADWKTHGKAAGAIRNALMLEEGKPDLVIAFPGGRGTADMVSRAKAAGVKVMEIQDE